MRSILLISLVLALAATYVSATTSEATTTTTTSVGTGTTPSPPTTTTTSPVDGALTGESSTATNPPSSADRVANGVYLGSLATAALATLIGRLLI